MHNPVLYGLLHTPQLPITPYHDVTGLHGFGILCKIIGAEVIVMAVPGMGSIALHEISPTGSH
ncbi:hypothetical protein EDB89DRAFT_2062463 [Lactarius sanguifluus]|nr:hypothetical protein EDB89DRAFT_2062463 [Lactarius sanguifluus]